MTETLDPRSGLSGTVDDLLIWLCDDHERGLSSRGCERAANEIRSLRAAEVALRESFRRYGDMLTDQLEHAVRERDAYKAASESTKHG